MKKAEHRRIDGFELWCWRRLLRVPWIAGTFSQSILKEIGPGCSLEGKVMTNLDSILKSRDITLPTKVHPLDCKEIQPVHSEADQPWDFFGGTDAKAEIKYFGHLM